MNHPPDRIRVGFCRQCSTVGPAIMAGGAASPVCANCPGNERLVFVRYQLTKKMGTLKSGRRA